MKRILAIVLLAALLACTLSACERANKSEPETTQVPEENESNQPALIQATQEDTPAVDDDDDLQIRDIFIQPVTDDAEIGSEVTPEPAPQTNEVISGYATIESESLGFKFNYPSNWVNLPGRSSICYRQQVSGNAYPARVCITMKKIAHDCDEERGQAQMIDYLKMLRTQYDEKTFEVDKNVDRNTKFMGKSAMATTYLAYDGGTEIKGYVIMTYFGKYIFVYHFMCAFDDYRSNYDAMCYMRNSAVCTLKLDN